MNNTQIYENNCKEDIINNLQITRKHSEYSVGKSLYATSDKGKRPYQEDSVIIHAHPKDKDIKLIAVADGVGGYADGDIMSNHILKQLIKWFENITEEEQNTPIKAKESLDNMLNNGLRDLRISPYAASTLSVAVILKEKTLIANIGDSRVYIVKNNRLIQKTKDDSEVEDLYRERVILDKELKRFYYSSNMLNDAITSIPPKYKIHYKIINNKNYDKILATSDGVTDCLSTKQIENIIKNSKKEEITNNIVKNALILNSLLLEEIKQLSQEKQKSIIEIQEIIEEDYTKEIKGGKDNTTAAIYIRK